MHMVEKDSQREGPQKGKMRHQLVFSAVFLVLFSGALDGGVVDLTSNWDRETVLANPDKGWYHHYFDNGIDKYLLKSDDDLQAIPGMDHLYLRLAWSFLEPRDGEFDWSVIDRVIEKWTPQGYGISFRITCRETGLRYATPKWLVDKGVQGKYFENWGRETFEPDYGDPLFLQYLERFHRAFASRYDGSPWLRYVDIGSYGDWGEGHTSFGSRRAWPNEVMKQHIEIYRRAYPTARLVISDDFLHQRTEEAASDLRKYIDDRGISWRDDSILVGWYVEHYADTDTISLPGIFEDSWRKRPTILEMEHYHMIVEGGNWKGRNGSERGASILRGACAILHPTWIGYHGFAGRWLKDNPELTRELANRSGYWYFPRSISLPDRAASGGSIPVELVVENHGYAPAYKRYRLTVRLEGGSAKVDRQIDPADNRRWMPDVPNTESFELDLPANLDPGRYEVKIRLSDPSQSPARTVLMGLSKKLLDKEGFYRIATIMVD